MLPQRVDEIVVLLSTGRSPLSGRARCAERDTQAIGLAKTCGQRVIGLHAGGPSEVLKGYIGMGLDDLIILPVDEGADPLPVLCRWVSEHPKALVLCGAKAEAGQATGLVPYLVAQASDRVVVPCAVALSVGEGHWQLSQALPGGRRRSMQLARAAVVTVDGGNGGPVQVAKAVARRAQLQPAASTGGMALSQFTPAELKSAPARRKPKRIGPVDPLASGDRQRLLDNTVAREAALEILRYLVDEHLISVPESFTTLIKRD